MWESVRESRKSGRLAMAGSIYMRKKSLEATVYSTTSRDSYPQTSRNTNPSSGKIVKNKKNSITIADKVEKFTSQVCKEFDAALSSTLKHPLTDKKNIISTEVKKHSPAFANFDQHENAKIKKIEEKYRSMLENYEKKKKAISSELYQLQSGEVKSSSKKKIPKKVCVQNKPKPQKKDQNEHSFGRKNSVRESDEKEKKIKQKLVERFSDFFTKIKGQIQLEEDIRKIKYRLQNKEKEVEQILLEEGKSAEEIQQLVKLDLEETDPFFVAETENLSVKELVKILLRSIDKSDANWKENVEGIMKVEEGKVLFNELNFEKKDEISMRSLVREVGFHLQKHYRNRDLLKIYERIKPCNEEAFLKAFCAD